MSAAGLLSTRISLGRAARSLRVGSSAFPFCNKKGLESVGKFITTSPVSGSIRKSYPTTVSGAERLRRLYSSEGLAKSAGDMKIAIIGQSMFGKEVSYMQNRHRCILVEFWNGIVEFCVEGK